MQEKTEKPDANLDAVQEKGNSDGKESDNTGGSMSQNTGISDTSDSVKPGDMLTLTESGHTSFTINSQTPNLSEDGAAESTTRTVSGTSTNNLDDDSHQLFSGTEDNLAAVGLPETTTEECS